MDTKYVDPRFEMQPLPAIAAGRTGLPAILTAGGVKATGTIVFAGQPSADDTITINGTAFTFKASGATGNQIDIGATLPDTLNNIGIVLNASVVAGVALATYTDNDTTTVTVTYDAYGTAGNAFTLAKSGTNITVSGATLSGGQSLPSLDLNTEYNRFNLTQAVDQNFVLGDGEEGQKKTVYIGTKSGAGNAVITPTNLRDYTTITLDTAGDWAVLQFLAGEWTVTGSRATLA